MRANNIFSSMNQDTELASVCSFDSGDTCTESVKDEYVNDFKTILSIFKIKKENINIKKDIYVYALLCLFVLIAVIDLFISKNISNLISVLLLTYVALLITSNMIKIINSNYMHISIWNLNASLNMMTKAMSPKLISELDYSKLISILSIMFMAILLGDFILSISFVSFLLLFLLFLSYIYSFCNKDIDTIKESTKHITLYSPIAILISTLVGSLFKGSNSINCVGFLCWLIIYYINNMIADYNFKEI